MDRAHNETKHTEQHDKQVKRWQKPRLTPRGTIESMTRGTAVGVGDSDNFNNGPALS